MHLQTLKSPLPCSDAALRAVSPGEARAIFQNPRGRPNRSVLLRPQLAVSCKGNGIAVVDSGSSSGRSPYCCREEERARKAGKVVDVATLGNLCVDIVLNVPELPPDPFEERLAYMERLAASRPDKKFWEAGGSCNLAIAAARLGLRCITLGHVGKEIYGRFLLDVLHDEGIDMVEMDREAENNVTSAYETLLCWVLVDPWHRHGFCSRADFSEDPAFSWMTNLSGEVRIAIKQTKIIFCNGYVFDELSPRLISTTVEYAIDVGTAVFFDPGPRGKTLLHGTLEQQRALQILLLKSDVLLLTSEEASSLTGITDPILSGQELIRRGVRTKWVIIKMGPKGSILITRQKIFFAPGLKVEVVDTVGCGDSFSAAIVYGFLHGMTAINTLALANAVGASTAMGCGAGRSVATLDKVLELLKNPYPYEEDNFWDKMVNENSTKNDITLLSTAATHGKQNRVSCVSMQRVVSELLPALCEVGKGRIVGVIRLHVSLWLLRESSTSEPRSELGETAIGLEIFSSA
ncbi:hypothetical protein H6P81_005483 [Aristolochia fimbriata]|uniref:Carbohydrate kinase PfkB domain-containing protein n=1 Tax=Aristolochia fimbriata TaxID=158543 RepID=A0AAV7EVB1_ARIFI|nr:hypothetical protein H6P81_005483 [Aristolochia fimbriata]